MEHVLITGGSGFIGSHLAERLIRQGCRVTVMDDLSTGTLANLEHLRRTDRGRKLRICIESIRNEMVLDRLISECDMVYHLAAAVGVRLIVERPVHVLETNILGTGVVLNSACRYRKKVLIASTSEIYGKSEQFPFKEEDDRVLGSTTRSRWCYSDSKAVDEFLALAYFKEKGLQIVIARLFNTIGPRQTGQYGMVVPRFVKHALTDEPLEIYGDGRQSRCFLYVTDTVDALMAIAGDPKASGEIFNVGSEEEIMIRDLAEKIILMTKSSSSVSYVPYENAYQPGFEDMRRRVPDISKIREWVGFRPRVSLDEALQLIIKHYRNGASKGPARHEEQV